MAIEQLFLNISLVWLLSWVSHHVISIVGANIYRIDEARRIRRARKPRGKQPLVSVMVYVDDLHGLESCLASIRQSSYRKHETIIVVDAPTAQDRRDVRRLVATGTKLYITRTHRGYERAMYEARKKHAKGELTLDMRAGDRLSKDSIKDAVLALNDSDGNGLIANTVPESYPSLLSIYIRFAGMLEERTLEMASLSGRLRHTGQQRTIFRADSHASGQIGYASGFIVHTDGHVKTTELLNKEYGRASKGMSGLISLVEPVAVTYFFYVALRYQDFTLLGLNWIILTASLLLALWSKKPADLRRRLADTLYLPMVFLLFYFASVLRLCLWIYRDIQGLWPTSRPREKSARVSSPI